MAARTTIDYGIEWGRFGILLGKRIEAGDYSILHTKGKKLGLNDYGPTPWIGDVSLEIADGSQIVHVIPLFDGTALRGATKRAIITELLPLERCLSSAAMIVASIWIGRTYAEFVTAARGLR